MTQAHGELHISQNDRLRHTLPARVDLETGALYLDAALSRDAYDWGLDQFSFRMRGGLDEVGVEEGTEFEGAGEVDFCVHPSELPDMKRAWEAYIQGTPSRPGRRIG